MSQRWTHAPGGSHWGEFGTDDQRGQMNLVTPAKMLQGIAEVREGRTLCLSLPLDVPGGQAMNPRRIAPRRYAVVRDGKSAGQQSFCWSYAGEDSDLTDVANDDVVLMSLQYSTQWDSLAHVGSRFDADGDGVAEMVFYNGFRAREDIRAATDDPGAADPYARYAGPEARALGIPTDHPQRALRGLVNEALGPSRGQWKDGSSAWRGNPKSQRPCPTSTA